MSLPDPTTFNIPFRKLTSIDLPADKTCSFGLIASTRSGKSCLLAYIWERYFKDDFVTVMMTGSPHGKIYDTMRKHVAISPAFYPELIKDAMKMNLATKSYYKTCFVFDDMLDGKNTKALAKLFCIGRNLGLASIISAQELSILNAVGRTNLNYILCGRLNSNTAVEKIVRNYLRHILPPGSIGEQIAAYNMLVQDHRFIVIDCLANEVFLTKLDPADIKC